jgi:hypothetical protein
VKKKRNPDWEEELAKEANDEAAREKARAGGGMENRISIRNRKFSLGGELVDKETKGKSFRGVIVDFAYLRTYYDTKYDEENPGPPTCFALSEDGEDMKPHKNSGEAQARACEKCPMSEPGSGGGKRQACAARRRLGIIHIDDMEDADAVAEATVAVMEIPVMSIRNWSKFVKACKSDHARPFYAVVCKFGFDGDADYPVVTFEPDEEIDDEDVVKALQERREAVREMLMTPYEQAAASGGKKKRKSKDDEDDDNDGDEDDKKRRSKDDADDDEDEDDKPTRKKRRSKDEDDDDEDEDDGDKKSRRRSRDDDEDDDEEDEKPKRRRGKKDEDEDDDEDDDDEDEDDADEEEDEKEDRKSRKSRGKAGKRDDDDEDEDDKPARKKRGSKDEDDDEEDEPRRKRGSRFGK